MNNICEKCEYENCICDKYGCCECGEQYDNASDIVIIDDLQYCYYCAKNKEKTIKTYTLREVFDSLEEDLIYETDEEGKIIFYSDFYKWNDGTIRDEPEEGEEQ